LWGCVLWGEPEQAVADVSINIAGQEYSYMEWNSEVENGMEQSLYTVTFNLCRLALFKLPRLSYVLRL